MESPETDQAHGAWNPGLQSSIPKKILPLSTMFATENVSTSFTQAHELGDFSGIDPIKIVAFRPERLLVHELLLRLMADFTIDAGSKYKDLGINVRKAADDIYDRFIKPNLDTIIKGHAQLRQKAEKYLAEELSKQFSTGGADRSAVSQQNTRSGWFDWLKKSDKTPTTLITPEQNAHQVLNRWQACIADCDDSFEKSCLTALHWTVSNIVRHRGALVGDHSIAITIAANVVCNNYGSEQVGRAIEPYLAQAIEQGGYRKLPPQKKPIIMNVKGASGAGKSTMRQQQKKLAKRLGVDWGDFALISPDIWRKFLLDYDSLGEAYKYAGMLSGHELEIIDKKLDQYMASKAGRNEMSHLLIDRFRFDSFIADGNPTQDSKLLSRFGDTIFMFFMITPPDATVERAWLRGLEFGRYKAVDDLLHHNVEAFTGMPALFFNWAGVADKKVHYEFLDNSVAKGKLPRTVAFGWNGEMTILDIKCLLDIDRYTKINVDAESPHEVYSPGDMAAQDNIDFLEKCTRLIPVINFADHRTGKIYSRMENGKWVWRDEKYVAKLLQTSEEKIALDAIGWSDASYNAPDVSQPESLEEKKTYTLGEW